MVLAWKTCNDLCSRSQLRMRRAACLPAHKRQSRRPLEPTQQKRSTGPLKPTQGGSRASAGGRARKPGTSGGRTQGIQGLYSKAPALWWPGGRSMVPLLYKCNCHEIPLLQGFKCVDRPCTGTGVFCRAVCLLLHGQEKPGQARPEQARPWEAGVPWLACSLAAISGLHYPVALPALIAGEHGEAVCPCLLLPHACRAILTGGGASCREWHKPPEIGSQRHICTKQKESPQLGSLPQPPLQS